MHFKSLILIIFLSLSTLACSHSETPAPNSKPTVVASIFAYYDAARAIAGDKANVQILLPPNQSPHEYELSFEDKIKLSKAALFIYNGLSLDDRFAAAIDSSAPTLKLNISTLINSTDILAANEVALGEKPAESEIQNPHIWLDPLVQIKAAEAIRDQLIKIDPADTSTFQSNADSYIASLHALDADFKAAVPTFKTTKFIGFHSAYQYLAKRYGLQQIASIEELPGEGITPAQAQKIIALIQQNHIHYVAKETAFNEKGADAIVRETGVKLITLQPLETYDNPSDTYTSLMHQNLEALKTALGT